MLELNLLDYSNYLDIKQASDSQQSLIRDPVRKKWLVLQPEELVRQLFVQYCIREGVSSLNHISIEREISVAGLKRRYDVALHTSSGEPWLLAECKAHTVALDQNALDQIARYNLSLEVPYLLVTNGRHTHVFSIDFKNQLYTALNTFPSAP